MKALIRSGLIVVLLFNVSDAVGQVNLSNGLVGHYELDGDIDDASGNDYHGTGSYFLSHGSRFLTGQASAIRFFADGPPTINIPHNEDLAPMSYTVNMWFRPPNSSTVSNAGNLITKSSGQTYYRILYNPDTENPGLSFIIDDGAGTTHTLYSSEGSIPNQWHMVTMIYDNLVASAYVNGKLQAQTTLNSAPVDMDGDIYLGAGFRNAALDDLRIYNRAINEEEIDALYRETIHADFSVDAQSIVAGTTVTFTDLSTADGTITSWEWDFTNDTGFEATTQNPSYTFENPGVYSIELTVSDGTHSTTRIKHGFVTVRQAEVVTEINSAEYFFDDDPGIGLGTALAIDAGAQIDEEFSVDVDGLDDGFHKLFIRMQDDGENWSLYEGRTFYIQSSEQDAIATLVNEAEYFFDQDPGIGLGTAIELSSNTLIDLETDIVTTDLDPGFHKLFIRVKDDLNIWSLYQGRTFYIQSNEEDEVSTIINSAEYFFDDDPGIGLATPIDLTAEAAIDLETDISTSGLEAGFHKLFIRVEDDVENWSLHEGRTFYIQSDEQGISATLVNSAEYFFDNDPGFGLGTSIDLTGNAQIDLETDISTVDLTPGFHRLFIRVGDDLDNWSLHTGRTFYIQRNDEIVSATLVNGAEYFFDDDPGLGMGTTIDLASNDLIDLEVEVATVDLEPGFHQLYIRIKDDLGHWSLSERRTLFIQSIENENVATVIQAAEYFIDTDPGFGLGNTLNIGDPTMLLDIQFDIDPESLDFGEHVLYLRVQDDLNNWSLVAQGTFTYEDKLGQEITFNSFETLSYGSTVDLDAVATSGLSVSYESSDPSIALITNDELSVVGVGEATITASQEGDDDYVMATSISRILSTSKASLTIEGNHLSRNYGDDNPELTVVSSGFVFDENESNLDNSLMVSTDAVVTSDVGVYDILVESGDDGHYDITTVNGSLTVDQAELTATADDQSKVYGASVPDLSITYVGFVNGDDQTSLESVPTASTAVDETSDVGSYDISLSSGADNNYLISTIDGTLTVTQASLTATADDQQKTYGESNPALSISYSGFVNDDDEDDLDNPSVGFTIADENSDVGDYEITASGGSDLNYEITEIAGTLIVDKALLTATADDLQKTYGESNPSLSISYTGFVNDEDENDLDSPSVVFTTADETSDVGDYDITISGGNDLNYDITEIAGTLTVDQATLTATADDQQKTYGESNPSLSITYTGFVNDDDEGDLDSPPVATSMADELSHTGDYTIGISEGTDNNYDIIENDGVLTINKASLSAAADDQTRLYGAVNPDLTITYIGFVNDDTATELDTPPVASTIAEQTSDVGDYSIELSEGTDNNYEIATSNGALSVTKALLTATADDQSKVYGEANPELTITYIGFTNDDDPSDLDSAPGASTIVDESSDVGSYDIEISEGTDNNYEITEVNGLFTINQATLTASADNQSKVYGEANPELTITYDGFVNNDDPSSLDIAPTAFTSADVLSNAGAYDIELSDGSDNNYDVVEVAGTLTVNKASLTITADDQVIELGSEIPTLTMTFTGFVNGDDENDITIPNISTDATAESDAGTYDIVLEGGDAMNYDLSLVNGTLTIEEVLDLISQHKGLINVLPNPITHSFSLKGAQDVRELRIYNMRGQLVRTFNGRQNLYQISDLLSGMYTLVVVFDTEMIFKKLLKK